MKTRRSNPKRPPLPLGVRLFTPTGPVAIRWPKPGSKELAQIQQQAMKWTHVVRNRARWIGTPSMAEQQDVNARRLLEAIGIRDELRRQVGDAGFVRVDIPYATEEDGWEARILPWEFLLSAGTRDVRQGPLVVTRSLLCSGADRPAVYKKLLFVESAPGRLENEWDFEDERRLVEKYAKAQKFERLVSPTRSELSEKIAASHFDIVHLAGFDNHQGLELLKDPVADDVADGYLLAAEGGADPVSAMDLRDILSPRGKGPSLVFCNIWNSAARIAPLLVAAGARSVVGFQDGMDDGLSEIFVGNFYRALADTKDPNTAFDKAWQSLQMQRKPLRGSGIVLWRNGADKSIGSIRATTQPSEPTLKSAARVKTDEAREMLLVTVEPEPQFSYGLLHNDRDLFRKFLIRNLSDAQISGVDIFVELHSNEGTYPYRQTITIEGTARDLTRDIRIALTSNLARTLDEVLRTSLYVQVRWGQHEIFSETFPVTLAPVDQWADTDADRIFLPSFVFPRDRAVSSIIKNAEQFMTVLRDDPTAGFDGYQSLDSELSNPAQYVDNQVQAVWYSAVYKVPASYINPPPTYAVASQRIRTPSEIVSGGFGTCIDLALMFASCLEAIEIYPVIFLLQDHAFPGYWRTDAAREAFCRRVASSASNPGTPDNAIRGAAGAAKRKPGAPWCFDAAVFEEIKRAIERRQLVPLETVGLTGRSSLGDSIIEAREYFEPEEANRFLMMLDLATARERRVTPLPLGSRVG